MRLERRIFDSSCIDPCSSRRMPRRAVAVTTAAALSLNVAGNGSKHTQCADRSDYRHHRLWFGSFLWISAEIVTSQSLARQTRQALCLAHALQLEERRNLGFFMEGKLALVYLIIIAIATLFYIESSPMKHAMPGLILTRNQAAPE